MHDFDLIKSVCAQAMNENCVDVSRRAMFYNLVDPELVLELIGLVEESVTTHELEALTILIRDLTNHLEEAEQNRCNITLPDRDRLIRQAKYMLSIYGR